MTLQLDNNKSIPTGLTIFKTKVDEDVCELETLPVDLNKFSDVADNQVVKNEKLNILNTKVNNLEKNPDVPTLIYINEYNTHKQNFEKKFGDVDKKNTRYK